jgi:hypothetical protein
VVAQGRANQGRLKKEGSTIYESPWLAMHAHTHALRTTHPSLALHTALHLVHEGTTTQ